VGIVLASSSTGQTEPWPAWLAPGAAAAGAVALIVWAWTARTAADPVLPLRLFRDRTFTIPAAISFLIGFALFGTISYLPAFLQIARGTTATEAGLVVTVLMGGIIAAVAGSGRAIARTGHYKPFPIAGTALATIGLALLGTVNPDVPTPLVLAYLLVIGLVMQVMVLVAQNGVPYRDLGAATSTVTFLRQIGAATGVAVVGAVITPAYQRAIPSISPASRRTSAAASRPRSERPSRRSSPASRRCSGWRSCWPSPCPRSRCATSPTSMRKGRHRDRHPCQSGSGDRPPAFRACPRRPRRGRR
jgi:hypothetical protein